MSREPWREVCFYACHYLQHGNILANTESFVSPFKVKRTPVVYYFINFAGIVRLQFGEQIPRATDGTERQKSGTK
jgi:hypothetical protein